MPRSYLYGHTYLNLIRKHIESVHLSFIICLRKNQKELSIFSNTNDTQKYTFQCAQSKILIQLFNFLLRQQYYSTDLAKLCKWLNKLLLLKIHENYLKESLVRCSLMCCRRHLTPILTVAIGNPRNSKQKISSCECLFQKTFTGPIYDLFYA